MSKLVSQITLGIDVCKDELVICDWDTEAISALENQASAIKAWLKSLYGPVRIAIEPTSHYHLEVVEQAHALGIKVYLINPRQLAHYRVAVNVRNMGPVPSIDFEFPHDRGRGRGRASCRR